MMMKGLMIHEEQQHQLILEDNMSNLSSVSGDQKAIAVSTSENRGQEIGSSYHPNHQHYFSHPPPSQSQPPLKKKRNLPGNPDPEAEVIALSPKTLMATNRFLCEICNKGFQRDQNLQLHRRGHNLPWKLKQRNKNEVVRKKVYVCPEVSCVHHEPSRALGDLTGIKKHFCRKHGEKKWKCDKCSKKYAVQSDWKAHSKTCGTREYRCDCGTLFSRRDSFITHRAFCDALAEESARAITGVNPNHSLPVQIPTHFDIPHLLDPIHTSFFKKEHHQVPPWLACPEPPPLFRQGHRSGPDPEPLSPVFKNTSSDRQDFPQSQSQELELSPSSTGNSGGPPLVGYHTPAAPSAHMSATALLQKAAQMGTSHLSRGTSVTAPCTTSTSSMLRPHHQQYQAHVSAGDGTSGSSGLHLSSRDHEEMMALASYGNKAGPCAGAGGPSPHNHPPLSSPTFLHHHQEMNMSMMMMSSDDGFVDGSTFEDAFGQILDAKKEEDDDHDHDYDHDHHLMMMMNESRRSRSGNGGNIVGGGWGNDGMTRDFLGLRALSNGDILSIAGAGGLAAPASLQEP